jgi:hypothetical protein
MVVVDTTILMLLFRPDAGIPSGPDGVVIECARERVEYLITTLEKAGTKVIIPTPVLSELLVRAGSDGSQKNRRANQQIVGVSD